MCSTHLVSVEHILFMYANVITDIASSEVDKIFAYTFDDDSIQVGSRVKVPFGSKIVDGIVISITHDVDYDKSKIKKIISSPDEFPALTKECLQLVEFLKERYSVPTALILRLFIPTEMRKGKVRELFTNYAILSESFNEKSFELLKKSAKKQKEGLEFLQEVKKIKLSELNNKFGQSAINKLRELNLIEIVKEKSIRQPYTELNNEEKIIELTNAQKNAIESVLSTDKQISLLHGVTGSGKTEVYLNLIKNVINKGQTAIMLVPEIALTPQMLKQLRAKFKNSAAILHSGLSAGEKFDEWWRIRNGEAKIVIGARSAIFAPCENIGIIIIDEEHETSYISETSPKYSAIDIAKLRAKYNNAKIVLGSATPSIESYLKAVNGAYNLIELKERVNKKPMPEIIVTDMRKEVRSGNNTPFSLELRENLKKCIENHNQAILFLNQRGYSKSIICTDCGEVIKCPNCDVSLTYHSDDESLLCHYCGAKFKMVKQCLNCGSKHVRYSGIGTQRIVQELQKLLPNAKILRMDRDSTQTKEGHFKILQEFREGKADILVGTQMIAKGHDFPNVTLVGILDADMSLHFADYRSSERTFQLITQVAGRSGRADNKGIVILQTYNPNNITLNQALNYNYKKFFETEISLRKATKFPPFTKIIRVLISSPNEDEAIDTTKILNEKFLHLKEQNLESFCFYGCMKAPIKKLENKFRMQVLMRIYDDSDLLKQIYLISQNEKRRNVWILVEENPSSLI